MTDRTPVGILSPDITSDCSMTLHRHHWLAMSVTVQT
jgi:hypothetical protein